MLCAEKPFVKCLKSEKELLIAYSLVKLHIDKALKPEVLLGILREWRSTEPSPWATELVFDAFLLKPCYFGALSREISLLLNINA